MGFSIVKVYRESLPDLKFIGKRYTDSDRADGTFGAKWGEWFANGWFAALEKEIEMLPKENEGMAYLGFMREKNGIFEYWIGMFASESSPVPLNFEYISIPAGDIATAWVHGHEEKGEIYWAHDACVSKFTEKGWILDDKYAFERYQCPRFTNADKDGKVILDYCIYLK